MGTGYGRVRLLMVDRGDGIGDNSPDAASALTGRMAFEFAMEPPIFPGSAELVVITSTARGVGDEVLLPVTCRLFILAPRLLGSFHRSTWLHDECEELSDSSDMMVV